MTLAQCKKLEDAGFPKELLYYYPESDPMPNIDEGDLLDWMISHGTGRMPIRIELHYFYGQWRLEVDLIILSSNENREECIVDGCVELMRMKNNQK